SGLRTVFPSTPTRPAAIHRRASARDPSPAFEIIRSSVFSRVFVIRHYSNSTRAVPVRPCDSNGPMKIPRLRWIIAAMLGGATLLNYLDRQALGIVSVEIRREFHLNEQDYATVIACFLVAYAIMYAGSGWVLDRLGTRRGFAVFMIGWSGAQMLHGLATGRATLSLFRFMLGFSEPGAWPAAAKAINEWFPARQRALVMGIFNAGTSLGSMLAPVVVATLTIRYGWRAAFVF